MWLQFGWLENKFYLPLEYSEMTATMKTPRKHLIWQFHVYILLYKKPNVSSAAYINFPDMLPANFMWTSQLLCHVVHCKGGLHVPMSFSSIVMVQA